MYKSRSTFDHPFWVVESRLILRQIRYFSFKHQSSFDSLPSLKLGNSQISRVYSYKYLGLTFTCTLSWLVHINQTISKAKRLLGLIYRQFYHYSSSSTLLSLYTTIVRPILEYGSTIWDASSTALSTSVEKVQFFALKIISKTWSTSYSNLLSSVNISSLEHRRRSAKLLLFFKLSNNLHFISSFPCHRSCKPEYALRHYSIFDFSRLFCRTSSLANSFFPSTIKLWNSLPSSTKSTQSISYFKFRINCDFASQPLHNLH